MTETVYWDDPVDPNPPSPEMVISAASMTALRPFNADDLVIRTHPIWLLKFALSIGIGRRYASLLGDSVHLHVTREKAMKHGRWVVRRGRHGFRVLKRPKQRVEFSTGMCAEALA